MPLISPFGRATCPFCFARFHLSEAPRRDVSRTAPTEPDERVAQFLRPAPVQEMGRVEAPPNGGPLAWLRRRFVATTDEPPWRKICPECHMVLPAAMASGELSSQIIAIVGGRSTGKSNFFGVLIDRLQRRYNEEVDFVLTPQESFSVRSFKRATSSELFEERYGLLFRGRDDQLHAVPQTDSGTRNADIRIPLIYRINFPKHGRFRLTHPLSHHIPVDLVIFDAAGEDLEDLATMEQFTRYCLSAAGIIFILDPLQFPGIRRELGSEVLAKHQVVHQDPSNAVSQVINLFQTRGKVRPDRKIPIPAAFTLSKCDLLRPIVPPDSLLHRESRHRGGFNRRDCYQFSADLAAHLREWDSDRLIGLARDYFQDSCFFGISALGCSPEGTDLRIPGVNPFRVGDPLLWLFWKLGYIRALED
jgi:hypothetical protein